MNDLKSRAVPDTTEWGQVIPRVFQKTVRNYGDRVAMRKKEYGLWHAISWNDYYRAAKYVGSALSKSD